MRSVAFGFLLGAVALQGLSDLPDVRWCWLALAGVPLLLHPRPGWRFPAAVVCGFLWAAWTAHDLLTPALPESLAGRDLQVAGRVVSLPERLGNRTRFEFDVSRAFLAGAPVVVPERLRLTWYRGGERVQAGAPWRLTVRLKRPRGFSNPGGFDYEGWLFRQGIGATGYVRRSESNAALGEPAGWLAVRGRLREAVTAALDGHPAGGFVTALVLGDRSGLSAAHWTVLQRTGTGHLMAISGLHVGLVAGLAFLLARWLWLLRPRNALRCPAPRIGALAALLAAGVYAALAGFSVPTQRAWAMVGVAALAVLSRRHLAPFWAWSLALLLVLLWDPLAVGSAGFWLSFAAVAVIAATVGGRVRPLGRVAGAVRVQLAVTAGLAPLLAVWFGRLSLVAPLANLVAIPLVSVVVVPVALLGALVVTVWPGGGGLLLGLAADAVGALMRGLTWLADGPLAEWPTPDGWAWLPAALGAAVLLAPAGFPGRWLGFVLLAPLVLARPPSPPPGVVWLTLLDVGQGLAAVVRTHRHTLVYDTGARYSDRFDTGAAVVAPFLAASDVARVDRLFLSHADNDHSGGARSLMDALPVGDVWTSDPAALPDLRARPCIDADAWEWDGVRFEVLHPPRTHRLSENDASCVLRVTAGARRLLLPGDVQTDGERRLLRVHGGALAADVLVVPHHGSDTSSTPAFVAAVRPSYALVSAGYRNRYGFPDPAVVARYTAIGARVLNTATAGAVTLRLGPGNDLALVETHRAAARRFWRAP